MKDNAKRNALILLYCLGALLFFFANNACDGPNRNVPSAALTTPFAPAGGAGAGGGAS